MNDLPVELIAYIFQFLNSSDIVQCSYVNKIYREASNYSSIWMHLSLLTQPSKIKKYPLYAGSIRWKNEYHWRFACIKEIQGLSLPFTVWDMDVNNRDNLLLTLNEESTLGIFKLDDHGIRTVSEIIIPKPRFDKTKICLGGSILRQNSTCYFSQENRIHSIVCSSYLRLIGRI